jgi:hypothetical protein
VDLPVVYDPSVKVHEAPWDSEVRPLVFSRSNKQAKIHGRLFVIICVAVYEQEQYVQSFQDMMMVHLASF